MYFSFKPCGIWGSVGGEYTCIFDRRPFPSVIPFSIIYFPLFSDPSLVLSYASSLSLPFRIHTMAQQPEVVFSSDVANMDDWAQRTNIPLTTADALGATYARAHRWLQALKLQLISDYHWTEVPSNDSRLLLSLETSSIWRSSVDVPAGPKLKLQLPVHASSFFSPERRIQWQMVFHSDTFESVRKICTPINDILNLIQCLLTGLVTFVFDERMPDGIYRTTRGLPPIQWITANESSLIDIFGQSRFRALRKACNDTKTAFRLEVLPYH